MVEPHSSNFTVITTNFLGVRIFRKFKIFIMRFLTSVLAMYAMHNHKDLRFFGLTAVSQQYCCTNLFQNLVFSFTLYGFVNVVFPVNLALKRSLSQNLELFKNLVE